MTFLATSIVLLLQALAGAAVQDGSCPVLPANSEMRWDYQQIGDIGVCYAIEMPSGERSFGIYLGERPRMEPSADKVVGKGIVGGHHVTWHKLSERYFFPEPPRFSQEALIEIDPAGQYAHVWVTASSLGQFERRLSVLERIQFR